MVNAQLLINEKSESEFSLMDGDEKIGELVFSLSPGELTVYHTEVIQKPETKGFGRKLFDAMVAYARENSLKIIPLCPYIHTQFKKNPEEFADVWDAKT